MLSSDEDDDEASLGENPDLEPEVTPDIPDAPSVKTFDRDDDLGDISDVDSETLRAFVVAVIYANAALLFVALGPMVWFFEGWSRIGAILFVAGLLAGARTYQTYRSWERSREETTEAENAKTTETETEEPAETEAEETTDAEAERTTKPDRARDSDGSADAEPDDDASGSGDATPPEA